MTDETRIITGETHGWKGVAVTSGAAQIELAVVVHHSHLTAFLTEEQAEQLAADLHKRVNQMRNLRLANAADMTREASQ